ncbi:hypothetical protein WMY93_033419 [Mugilogobius chulae]|uniref:tRNA-intron lyase n=1 Tax=Mugilogobius chulae TaxID=88201 RepID=A0AAW0MKU2_9GOBI
MSEEGAGLREGTGLEQGAELVWSVQELRAVRQSGLVGALGGGVSAVEEESGEGEESGERGEESGERGEELEPKEEESEETQQRRRWEEFLGRSLEQQQRLALEDRKCALTSSLSGPALASSLSSLSSFSLPVSSMSVQISTCREGLALRPISSQQTSPKPIGERLQCRGRSQVFRDLRRRGFYLTSGGKFGVDFLVYPGDALRFHAHFMALCVSLDESLSLEDILCWVRLSSNVKKTLLLCSSTPPGGALSVSSSAPAGGVVYSSLQWSNMS